MLYRVYYQLNNNFKHLNYIPNMFHMVLNTSGEQSWPSVQGVGLRTRDLWFDTHTGHVSLLKVRQLHLPRFVSVYSAANEHQHY